MVISDRSSLTMPPPAATTLRLRQIREDRKLSRFELAVLSDTSEATIVRAERGAISPKLSHLEAWAAALETTVTELIGEA